jgi:predicted nuclease of predicted toxin-antitoxin system
VRFKLDENLGRSVIARMSSAGHDVSSVDLERLHGSSDRRLFEVCRSEARVLVSFDLDFANPLVFDPRGSAGVVVLRLPKDAGPDDVETVVDVLLAACKTKTIDGALWIVRSGRVRVWRPPANE